MVTQLNTLNLKKSKKDIEGFHKTLEQSMEQLIHIYLTLNFEDLFKIST